MGTHVVAENARRYRLSGADFTVGRPCGREYLSRFGQCPRSCGGVPVQSSVLGVVLQHTADGVWVVLTEEKEQALKVGGVLNVHCRGYGRSDALNAVVAMLEEAESRSKGTGYRVQGGT